MLKWNIRNQILLPGIISLLVLAGTIVYFYGFSKGEFVNNSQNLIASPNAQYVDQINGLFADRVRTVNALPGSATNCQANRAAITTNVPVIAPA